LYFTVEPFYPFLENSKCGSDKIRQVEVVWQENSPRVEVLVDCACGEDPRWGRLVSKPAANNLEVIQAWFNSPTASHEHHLFFPRTSSFHFFHLF
jgi:hypothetical protein